MLDKIKRHFLFIRKYGIICEIIRIGEKLHIKTNQSSAEIIAKYNSKIKEKDIKKEIINWFYICTGEKLDFENVTTYNEKIQWLKIYDNTQIKTQLTDKYMVRSWIKEKIGEEYLTKLYGVWDSFDEIDFNGLPNRFVLKCNHGCAMNAIVLDKNKMDIKDLKNKFEKWMKTDISYTGFELQYKNINKKIIAEEYMENTEGNLYDYKFWCNNGTVDFIMFLTDRQNGLKMANFDVNWNLLPFVYNYSQNSDRIDKPENLDEMIKIAEKLAKGFYHVRVDLYRLNDGSIKFGEMTFTSGQGIQKWNPESANLELGKRIKI